MFQVIPRRVALLAAIFCAVMVLELVSPVPAQLTKSRTFKQMVEESDQIVVGQCVESNTGVEGGKIVTQYKIQPAEFWKGQRPLASDGTFLMTEQGGSLAGKAPLPIAQFSPGQSDIAPGEDVLLFLSDRKNGAARPPKRPSAAKPSSSKLILPQKLQDSPIVVGRWQGRFSVVTHPTNGNRMIARGNISAVPGSPMNEEMRQRLLKARGLKVSVTKAGAKVAAKDATGGLTPAQKKKLATQLEAAASQARGEHAALAKRAPQAANEIYSFEPLDGVKARVLRIVKETK